ncbi:MAG TPA: J domain-containing protein [Pyrinomonadaceae bacterium]|jgi:hypothetical protein
MIVKREKCLELLGLKAGASAQEIKAAYRDLAKVWHPDRFAHDPRLQEKAQDKLKELNEAYEALTSPTFHRGTRTATTTARAPQPQPTAAATRAPRTNGRYQWPATLLVACVVATGLFFSPRLLQREVSETTGAPVASSEPAVEETSERDDASVNRRERKSVEKQKAPAVINNSAPAEQSAPLRPLPTVTVMIDPTTGMLAKASCPVKSSMTYPAGQEPHQYCSADHRLTSAATDAPTDPKSKSRLKSLANRMAAPARWLKEKSQQDNPTSP